MKLSSHHVAFFQHSVSPYRTEIEEGVCLLSHSSPREQATQVWSLKALLRTQQSSSDYSLIVALSLCQVRSCMLGPKITVCWLGQWPAPESRPSQLQSCQQELGRLPTGTEHPTQALGTVPAERGTERSWRPAEPVHTSLIVSGPNGETGSPLMGSKLPSALLSRCCLGKPFQGLFRTRKALQGHQCLPTGLLSAFAGGK